jgi:hypothetical protein
MSASCAERLSPSRLRGTRGRRPGGRHGRPSRSGRQSGRRRRAASRAGQGSGRRSARAHRGRSGEERAAGRPVRAGGNSIRLLLSSTRFSNLPRLTSNGWLVRPSRRRVGSPAPPGGCPDEWLTPAPKRVAESRVGTGASLRHEATPVDGAVPIRQRPVAELGSRLLPNWATSLWPNLRAAIGAAAGQFWNESRRVKSWTWRRMALQIARCGVFCELVPSSRDLPPARP